MMTGVRGRIPPVHAPITLNGGFRYPGRPGNLLFVGGHCQMKGGDLSLLRRLLSSGPRAEPASTSFHRRCNKAMT